MHTLNSYFLSWQGSSWSSLAPLLLLSDVMSLVWPWPVVVAAAGALVWISNFTKRAFSGTLAGILCCALLKTPPPDCGWSPAGMLLPLVWNVMPLFKRIVASICAAGKHGEKNMTVNFMCLKFDLFSSGPTIEDVTPCVIFLTQVSIFRQWQDGCTGSFRWVHFSKVNSTSIL